MSQYRTKMFMSIKCIISIQMDFNGMLLKKQNNHSTSEGNDDAQYDEYVLFVLNRGRGMYSRDCKVNDVQDVDYCPGDQIIRGNYFSTQLWHKPNLHSYQNPSMWNIP